MFYQFYFFPICSLYLVQTFKMVYVIALTSKLVFLLATFTPGPEIPLENKELPSCLTIFLKSPLSESSIKHSKVSLAESPLAPGWVGYSLCLLCNFSLSADCFHSQVLPVLLELVSIRRWFNPRKFLLENIFSHQMTYTLYTLVREYITFQRKPITIWWHLRNVWKNYGIMILAEWFSKLFSS